MAAGASLGDFEQLVMLALLRIGDQPAERAAELPAKDEPSEGAGA